MSDKKNWRPVGVFLTEAAIVRLQSVMNQTGLNADEAASELIARAVVGNNSKRQWWLESTGVLHEGK